MQRAGTEPVIFNLYVCLGVFVSGFFAIPFYSLSNNEVGVTVAGMVAGMLFVLAGLFSFLAIPELGLAIAQGVWGGSAVLVAFLWGAVGKLIRTHNLSTHTSKNTDAWTHRDRHYRHSLRHPPAPPPTLPPS